LLCLLIRDTTPGGVLRPGKQSKGGARQDGGVRDTTGRAVAARYGLGTPAGPPRYADRGERGQIWRLDTDRGRWAVKATEVEPPAEEDAADHVAFQEAAAAAGVPLPRPVRAADGRVLTRIDGVTYGVYEWVDLVAEPVTGAEIGAVAARLHALGHPPPGPVHPWFAEPVGPAGWAALHRVAVDAGAWWAEPLRRLLPDLTALDEVVTPPDPAATRTCHRDLNVENVRRTAAGPVTVLDWENSGALEPVRELAMVVVHLREDVSEAAALSAYASYLDAGGPTRVTRPADFSTAIVVQGHLLRYYGERSLDPAASAEDRDRCDRRVRAALARPLTPAAVDGLLSALPQ
jgi:Ser/Thr protein kinase RdoA (MazF antagonist)